MKKILALVLALLTGSFTLPAAATELIVGSYELPRMKSIKPLTFPRLHLYDAQGRLVEREAWPAELAALKAVAGEAYCCISDKPSPPGQDGPPPDCKKVVYGENLAEHFRGLQDGGKKPLAYAALPKHKFLLVEYYADWCAPCQPARRAMEAFLASPQGQEYRALVIDFSALVAKK